MEQTIGKLFYVRNFQALVQDYVSQCDYCQRHKRDGVGIGKLPPRNDMSFPFEEDIVDFAGPWPVNVNGRDVEFHALTVICTCTTLCEIPRIQTKDNAYMAMMFENEWLSHYPRPIRVIFDNRGEFTGGVF
jgi:hypothetical protein